MTRPILIAGPTASGKSALAVGLAQALGGVVINADSQQVYREWRILTARPTASEEAEAPHRLYGHIPISEAYSVGHWLREADPLIAAVQGEGKVPIVVGGTGLYFMALTEGLAEIPPTPSEIRAEGDAALARDGAEAMATALATRDPATAAITDMANPRRVQRAWEVLETTGEGLAAWKARTPPPVVPLDGALALALMPPRAWLYERCDRRFDAMIGQGVLDEVRSVLAAGHPPGAPGLRAVGAPELMAVLEGRLQIEAAVDKACMETRRYAKRQIIWIRNRMRAWRTLDPSEPGMLEHASALARAASQED